LHDVKEKPPLAGYVRFYHFRPKFPINEKPGLKGLSQDRQRAEFVKNLCASSFNTFSQLHLDGQ
jgi:hypothetical protein